MIRAMFFALLISWPSNVLAAIDWNENAIKWYEYSDGLKAMREEDKMEFLLYIRIDADHALNMLKCSEIKI
ncbi:MAG: hypothetical protein FIB02_01325 [Desulfuromonas sp.]|nr:hypothetical protein [Desulfuromonas sp.]